MCVLTYPFIWLCADLEFMFNFCKVQMGNKFSLKSPDETSENFPLASLAAGYVTVYINFVQTTWINCCQWWSKHIVSLYINSRSCILQILFINIFSAKLFCILYDCNKIINQQSTILLRHHDATLCVMILLPPYYNHQYLKYYFLNHNYNCNIYVNISSIYHCCWFANESNKICYYYCWNCPHCAELVLLASYIAFTWVII